jgi:hypothetical protein
VNILDGRGRLVKNRTSMILLVVVPLVVVVVVVVVADETIQHPTVPLAGARAGTGLLQAFYFLLQRMAVQHSTVAVVLVLVAENAGAQHSTKIPLAARAGSHRVGTGCLNRILQVGDCVLQQINFLRLLMDSLTQSSYGLLLGCKTLLETINGVTVCRDLRCRRRSSFSIGKGLCLRRKKMTVGEFKNDQR